MANTGSTLLLTLLLAIGLVFFLRAASKDRTTVVEVHSGKPALEVLEGLSLWLTARGWQANGGDPEQQLLRFRGQVSSSATLALLLSLLGAVGAACLGLVIRQLLPQLGWWPLLLALAGPLAGFLYRRRAERDESLDLRLVKEIEGQGCSLRLRAHRDELIALELELAEPLQLASDGALLSSPI
ncbi:cofactor assembly of complex C subunit B [Cyanobium sp. WAJ14-Wanaka]|uniref:cofactor assembly of complex C subunit B n=1 Tax=Cyanobium sp. WAJ14-Wanaka TaxID=2823725 RepID=UPI0020CE4CA1|nr:cofactor assembly of complex C subunit B [Cyanobium sp. WAJ14-Wanaka]MCP9776000.1 cofactor assembly of complex C subunit B [Cyanobium sp. WAJ14-Wanaka]